MAFKYLLSLLKKDREQHPEDLKSSVCLYRVRALQMEVVPEEMEICATRCDSVYQVSCPRYKSRGEVPIRKGKVPSRFKP